MMIFLSELSSPGNKKVPPFYPPIQGRSDDSPVTDNPKTNIMELHIDNGDDLKYISQFCLSRETVIDQKHHYLLLFYVQQLHNRIALIPKYLLKAIHSRGGLLYASIHVFEAGWRE